MMTAAELRNFWVALAFSTDGDQALAATGRRYQLPAVALDDLRQEWVLSLDRTLARHPELVDRLGTDEPARRYAFRTLRNRALDSLRGARHRAEVLAVADGDGATIIDRARAPDDVDGDALGALTLAELRKAVSARLTSGAIRCAGCRAPVVAQIALAVVDAFYGATPGGATAVGATAVGATAVGATADAATRLAGGTTDLDELIYHGLRAAAPDLVSFDDEGRATERTRQSKSRCGRCTKELLADVLARHASSIAIADGDEALVHRIDPPTRETDR